MLKKGPYASLSQGLYCCVKLTKLRRAVSKNFCEVRKNLCTIISSKILYSTSCHTIYLCETMYENVHVSTGIYKAQ